MPELQPRQFEGLPNVWQHDSIPRNPGYWLAGRWARSERRTLQPDHPLHTTQEYLDPHEENVYVHSPEINGPSYRPRVGHVPGVGDVIADGHHRIAAARLAGRPIEVDYRRMRRFPRDEV